MTIDLRGAFEELDATCPSDRYVSLELQLKRYTSGEKQIEFRVYVSAPRGEQGRSISGASLQEVMAKAHAELLPPTPLADAAAVEVE